MTSHTAAINDHLALEFQASHAYLAMSIWLREKDLIGFSDYMLEKSIEERGHASRMIAYLVDSERKVQLPTIQSPEREFQTVKHLFETVYTMEKQVTESINNIYTLSEQEGDRAATAMLDWFIEEQVKEESEARFVLKRLRLADSNTAALILLDQQFIDGTLLANVKAGGAFSAGSTAAGNGTGAA